MVAEKVLVEEELAVDDGGRGAEDGEDGVGEDGGAAQVVGLVGLGLCELRRGGGLDGLGSVSADSCHDQDSKRPVRKESGSRVGGGGGGEALGQTHDGGPNAGNGHIAGALALAQQIHGKALCQHAHADLAHGVGCLPAEEATIDRRADDDDAPAAHPGASRGGRRAAQVRKRSLDDGIQALGVDALHELEALEWRVGDGGPEDGARVVDEGVEAAVGGDGPGDELVDALLGAHVDGDGGRDAAGRGDLAGDGGDGGGGRVGVRGEGRGGLGGVADGFGGDDDFLPPLRVSILS